jgi:predicted ATPase
MVLNELQKVLGMEARLTGVFVSAHGTNLLNLLRQSSLEMQQRERVPRVSLIGQIANRRSRDALKSYAISGINHPQGSTEIFGD